MAFAHADRVAARVAGRALTAMVIACVFACQPPSGESHSAAPPVVSVVVVGSAPMPTATIASAVAVPSESALPSEPALPSAVAVSATASASAAAVGLERTVMRRLRTDLSAGPLQLTGSFDGSQRFSMWIDSGRFARRMRREHGKRVRFTYFINSCYYDPSTRGSQIGRAANRDEVLVRQALTQQLINEGHEIGNHGVGHADGGNWELARWREEFAVFHSVSERLLFKPVRGEDGGFAFPRFEAVATAAAGDAGSACQKASDCNSDHCLEVIAGRRFCSQPCNRRKPCPDGLVCGTPNFKDDTDVCVPVPSFPVVHRGKTLFAADGTPDLEQLKPYPIRGFRAPFLSFNDALVQVLLERHYAYDASQVARPGPPLLMKLMGHEGALLGFPLMQQPGARTIPMDYNYLKIDPTGERMLADYRRSLLHAYAAPGRDPWNIGHHFSQWHGGAYWRAMQQLFEMAARGCPSSDGELDCERVAFPSFIELRNGIRKQIKRQLRERRAAAKASPSAAP